MCRTWLGVRGRACEAGVLQVVLFLGEALVLGVAVGVVERGLLVLFITRSHPLPLSATCPPYAPLNRGACSSCSSPGHLPAPHARTRTPPPCRP